MPRAQRLMVYGLLSTVWATGIVWLVLDQFMVSRGPFGATPHPLAAPTLLLHGVASVIALYLFGWVTARHLAHWWPRRRRRISGGTLSACLGLLAVSGFALFFLTEDRWQHGTALAHDALGIAVTACAIQHWFFGARLRAVGARLSKRGLRMRRWGARLRGRG